MPVNLVCPTCRGVLPLPDDFVGEVVRCGNCAGLIPIPKIAAAPVVPPTSSVVAPIPVPRTLDIDFSETPSSRRSTAPKAATGGTKTLVIVMWAGVAAVTVGTVSFAGWLISRPKETIVVVEPPAVKPSAVTKPNVIPTATPTPPPDPSPIVKAAPVVTTPEPKPMPAPAPPPPSPPPAPPPSTPTPAPAPMVPIPRAVDLPRCVAYLSFDGVTPEEMFVDAVSKRKIGRGALPNFKAIEGKRNGGMRITFTQRDTGGFDITDQTGKLDFLIGQAYTMAYWVRFPNPITDTTIVFGMSGKGDAKLVIGLPDSRGQSFAIEYNHTVSKSRKETLKLTAPFAGGPGEWQHFAMTRTGDGKLAGYFNGEPMTGENKTAGDIVNFTLAGFGFSMANRGGEFDLDELAIFNRILPPADVKRLAGIKP